MDTDTTRASFRYWWRQARQAYAAIARAMAAGTQDREADSRWWRGRTSADELEAAAFQALGDRLAERPLVPIAAAMAEPSWGSCRDLFLKNARFNCAIRRMYREDHPGIPS